MNFLKKLLFTETSPRTLSEMIKRNSKGEQFREQILDHLRQNGMTIGLSRQLSPPIITADTKDIQYLTSTHPDNGEALLVFEDENALKNRNKNAYPFTTDINGIRTLVESLKLAGLAVISSDGWIFFPLNELH